MRPSLTGLSAARQTLTARQSRMSEAQILEIIFTGHCTPVERIQKGRLFTPPRLHANVEVEIDLHAEQPLHFLARQRADFLEHRGPGADHDGLLAVALHAD